MTYSFIEDGNKEDLTEDILSKYFKDDGTKSSMYGQYPKTSCAYKHILATQHILSNNIEGALILEDDIKLSPNFITVFNQSLTEYFEKHRSEAFISNYEESSLMFVPRSKRKNGTTLYKANRDRFTGCVFINKVAAKVICDYISNHRSSFESDRLHSHLIDLGLINYYWSHPCIACQCSCDGTMPTSIPTKPRPFKRLKWLYKKVYKQILFFFR